MGCGFLVSKAIKPHNINIMPRIRLKPGSAEFADDNAPRQPHVRACDMPGCHEHGEYKAPRDRSLSGHYWFCLSHVQEYNKAWDFFSGMSAREIEEQIVRSTLWDRPTRRYDTEAAMAEKLRTQAWKTYHFTDNEPPKSEQSRRTIERNTPESDALAIFGLEPPVDMNGIKTRYKELVKKYHPDVNPGDKNAEEMIKTINMSYTILRLAYAKFEQFEESKK